MQKSARLLGMDLGITAQAMNQLLLLQGFLTGEPGNYECTEKAKPYVKEKFFSRGTGGYAIYNPCWSTRSYDDSILDVIDTSDEMIAKAQEATKSARTTKGK